MYMREGDFTPMVQGKYTRVNSVPQNTSIQIIWIVSMVLLFHILFSPFVFSRRKIIRVGNNMRAN